ncbi:LysR substrate-binding domain-containing protein [Ochrobactrum sp. MYb379]|uniref:LysR substrate-binding domain-containing protein n=1 Tax=Ochrobactrum sp. MYb379 TaxID=2745275 RepID=UPI00309D0E3F
MLAAGPAITQPSDCLDWPLLQDSDRANWQLWFKAVGVADDPRAERGAAFDDDYLLVRAAIAGQGLALVRDVYAVEEIESGRLAFALDRPWPTQFTYYAVTLPDTTKRKAVQDFIAWLKEESGMKPV